MPAATNFRKNYDFYMFINTGTKQAPVWVRNTLSDTFTREPNPTSDEVLFISDEFPTQMNERHAPTYPQTLYTKMGDPLYSYLEPMYRRLLTGTEAQTQMLIVYPDKAEAGNIATYEEISFTWGTQDVMAGTIAYTINVRETIHGSATMVSGEPTFIPSVGGLL